MQDTQINQMLQHYIISSKLESNVLFYHKYGYIRDKSLKRSGVESYPYPVKEGQRYINLNPGRLFVQQPPTMGKGSKCTKCRIQD